LQVEILFVVIAVSGFSRCKKGTIEFFLGETCELSAEFEIEDII